MASDYEHIEKEAEKRYEEKKRRKRKRMKVSGKSVFTLQEIIDKNTPKRKKP